ncbi:MAG: SDR family oxidoreductase [Acidobacteriota bacterium]|nr:SDR family oxidoreductase [Acidobacteriota bacterium]MDQ5871407.1 SDR family oxidoreductase [Acidobacteriota bacterium]
MNLVVGATGVLGGEIASRLAEAGKPVRALVRKSSSPEKVEALRSRGIELAHGDLTDRASLDAACRGVHTVYSTATAIQSREPGNTLERVDREGQASLVDAAREAGVERFVFVSFRVGGRDFDFPLQAAKRETAERLKASGIPWTVIEASIFMEVWLGPHLGFDAANGRVRVFGSGDQKISWVSYKDVAAIAITAAENADARNRTLEVGGPEALSPNEVIRIFEDRSGRTFEVERVPEEALKAMKENATNPVEETFAGLMLLCAGGDEIDMRETLRRYPVRMTTVSEYAEGVLNR